MQGQKNTKAIEANAHVYSQKADNKINAHVRKQKHRQAIETNKSHLQMLTYISNAWLQKKTQRQAIEANAPILYVHESR